MEKAWNDWNRAHDASQINPLFKKEFCRIVAMLSLPPKAKILELGCGNGINRELFGADCDLHGTDIDEVSLGLARERGYTAYNVDVKDYCPEAFDLVFSVGLLEHFTFEEIKRIASLSAIRNNRIIAAIPSSGGLRKFIRALPPFKTPLWSNVNKADIINAFASAGYDCRAFPVRMIPHIPFPVPFVWWWIVVGEKTIPDFFNPINTEAEK